MARAELHTRPLTDDDLVGVLEVRRRSFGPSTTSVEEYAARQRLLLDAGRMLGVLAGAEVIAAARILPMQQSWGGRPVPMAGIAGVVVAPEHRGRGVGTMLMRATLQRAGELGAAVSALYPAAVPIYRHLGWELAGVHQRVSVPSHLLRALATPAGRVRRATPADIERILRHESRVYERGRDSGPLLHTPAQTRAQLEDPDVFSYVCDDGFVMYGWHGADLLVHQLVAECQESLRALWSVVGSGSSTAETVHAYVGPRDPLHLLLPATVALPVQTERWMLRVLDLPGAVAARGFPPAVTCAVPLRTTDHEATEADGSWLLHVAGGIGTLEGCDVEAEAVHLGARAVAALYAGTPVSVLRRAGLVSSGSPTHDAALDAAFGSDAYLLDYF